MVGLLGQASLPASLLIPLMLLAGFAGGAAVGGARCLAQAGFGVNEIIATIMLNFVALYGVSYLARGPLRDPMGYLPQSARLAEAARLPTLPGSRIHLGVLIALLLVPAIYVLLWKTTAGFRLRAVGSSARVALATGIDVRAAVALAFLTSGALAGLSGIIEVSALHARLKDGISGDYGFTGILVALLGRLHPAGGAARRRVLRDPDDRHAEHAQRPRPADRSLPGAAGDRDPGRARRRRAGTPLVAGRMSELEPLLTTSFLVGVLAAGSGLRCRPCSPPWARSSPSARGCSIWASKGSCWRARSPASWPRPGPSTRCRAAAAGLAPWLGLGAGVLAGLAMGLVMAVLSVSLRTDQVVAGIMLVALGYGATAYIYREAFGSLTARIAPMGPAPLPAWRSCR